MKNHLRLENTRSFTRFPIFILDKLLSMPAGENRSNVVKDLRFSASRYDSHECFGLKSVQGCSIYINKNVMTDSSPKRNIPKLDKPDSIIKNRDKLW